jgi:hypothetical protein
MNFLRACLLILSSTGLVLADDSATKKPQVVSQPSPSAVKGTDDATGANNVVLV